LATVNPDGSPQVTPVWVDENDGYVLVNTAVGRLKERNTRRDPRVALAVPDWEDPYTYVEIRGRVVERITGPRGRRTHRQTRNKIHRRKIQVETARQQKNNTQDQTRKNHTRLSWTAFRKIWELPAKLFRRGFTPGRCLKVSPPMQ
jgi:PPOX class probable F420-dependent enzyme